MLFIKEAVFKPLQKWNKRNGVWILEAEQKLELSIMCWGAAFIGFCIFPFEQKSVFRWYLKRLSFSSLLYVMHNLWALVELFLVICFLRSTSFNSRIHFSCVFLEWVTGVNPNWNLLAFVGLKVFASPWALSPPLLVD